jgi:aspartyl-tRNA(Asn)/glutamyl-tRNA(Gln) amidotransferase subunit A
MSLVHHLSISGLASAMDAGMSPVAIVRGCLDRIARNDGRINAMIHVDAEAALAQASAAEAEIKAHGRRGPLHGIPVAVKDMVDVAGWPTSAASRLFGGRLADLDAACVANLRAAGAIIIGKTNLHELTLGPHDNPWFGKVANPMDLTRGTAGTSSGSAAAVAAGFCAVAVGTDTGGSNRSVAAANGLFGFKPSNGLIDPAGTFPTAVSLDTVGPIATSLDDIRVTVEAMCGTPLRRTQDGPRQDAGGITIAICPDIHGAAVDSVVERSIADWLEGCRRRGARIVERPFTDQPAFVDAGLTILLHEFAQSYGALIDAHPERVGAPVRAVLKQAQAIDTESAARAQATRQQVVERLPELMQGVDLLAVPTAPGLAPRLSDETTRVGDRDVPFGLAGGVFRRWANMLGMPALAVPIPTGQKFPASLQLAALPGQDAALLDMAAALLGDGSRR